MKLEREPRHIADERDVDRFLAAIAVRAPRAAARFPRPIVTLLERCPGVRLTVEAARGLDARVIAATLRDRHGLSDARLPDDRGPALAAYTYAEEDHVVVFYDTQYPVPAQRFALAHQAGHLVYELLPELARPRQLPLFHRATFPMTLAVLARSDEGALPERRAGHFAVELLMPYRELRRLVASCPIWAPDDCVSLVCEHFCVSEALARRRLGELCVPEEPT